MQQILDRYSLRKMEADANGNPVLDEKGKEVYAEMSLENQRMAAEEFLAHLQETNGVPTGEIYADHKAEIDQFAREHGMDTHDQSARNIDRMTREWMAEIGFRPERPGWLKQIISRIRLWLNRHGFFVHHLTDDDILTILARSAQAEVARRRGKSAQGNGVRFALDEHGEYFPGPDEWGTAYTSMTGKGLDAVNFLLKKQDGWVPGAWHRDDIGDIDLVYGETNGTDDTEDEGGWGVAHIDKKHNVNWIEVNDIIQNGYIDKRSPTRIILKKHRGSAVVSLRYDNDNRNWLLSTFGTNYPSAGILSAASGNKGATAYLAPRGKFNIGDVWDQVKLPDEKSGEKSSEVGQVGQVGQVETTAAEDIQKTDVSKSDISDRSGQSDNTRLSIDEGAAQVDTEDFKRWFKQSKVVDENGDPLVVYHGTNWDMLSEAPDNAAFSDRERGTGSGDNGFFGRGFYFTFGNGNLSRAEAGYYGRNVYSFYLSIQKPFYFNETLRGWNGKRLFGDEVNSVEIVNAVKLFPELLKDYTLNTYDGSGEYTGEISLAEYAEMFEKIYKEKKFSFRLDGSGDMVITCDPVEHSENGDHWTEYGFEKTIVAPDADTDMQLLATHLYLENDMTVDQRKVKVEIPYNLLRDFYGEPEFRAWLEKQGYDGVMQSKNGDEVVAFYPEQIKSATDNVGTFDPNNPDVRYSIDDGEAGFVEPVPFTSSIDDSRGKNIVAMLRPIVGKVQSGFDKEVLARNIKEHYGVDVTPVEALLWAREAARQNYVDEMRRQRKVRDAWLYENNLLWKLAVDYAGSENFKVRVSERMNDRELSGTFWLKPGEKYSGTVVDLDALANEVARQQSRDALDVEQEFFDFFNGLDKPKLFHQYTEFRQQELAGDKEQARQAKEEWMRQEKYRIEDEVVRQQLRYRRSRCRPQNRMARLTAKAAITSIFPVFPPTILPVRANAPPAAIAAMAYRRPQVSPRSPQRTGTTNAPA